METSAVRPAVPGAAVLSAVGRTSSSASHLLLHGRRSSSPVQAEGENMSTERTSEATKAGGVFVYRHHDGSLGSMLVLVCDTDFLARSELFVRLGEDLARQVAALNPAGVEELLAQPFIRDGSR